MMESKGEKKESSKEAHRRGERDKDIYSGLGGRPTSGKSRPGFQTAFGSKGEGKKASLLGGTKKEKKTLQVRPERGDVATETASQHPEN